MSLSFIESAERVVYNIQAIIIFKINLQTHFTIYF